MDSEVLFPIRAVVRQTGLSPDTIRVWERRYQAVVPVRTPGGARRYTTADVTRLGLLREAIAYGHHVGDVARLSEPDLRRVVAAGGGRANQGDPAPAGSALGALCASYLDAVGRLDVPSSRAILTRAAILLAPEPFSLDFVLPVLKELGDRWARSDFTVAQEHFASAQLKGMLEDQLRWLSTAPDGSPTVVLATPEGHLHEFGALIGAQLAAARGWRVVYLGASVPVPDLLQAAQATAARLLVLSIARDVPPVERRRLAADLETLSRRVETWVGLGPNHALRDRLQVTSVTSFDDFVQRLDRTATGLRDEGR